MNISIAERAQCIILNAGLEKKLWVEVVSMTCYLINRSPRVALDGKVMEEVCTGNEVDYSRLRMFGCPAYAHITREERSKLDAKSISNNGFLFSTQIGVFSIFRNDEAYILKTQLQ